MLSKIIVNSWSIFIEISLWLLLLAGLIGGWQAGVYMWHGQQLGGFMGAIGGLIATFIISSMFLGAFLVLDDIRKSVKAIENKK